MFNKKHLLYLCRDQGILGKGSDEDPQMVHK